jgi:cellulose synthase/poly-beta-1,6-N-acetylglucosamine synthase-like glycosyltransferase
VISEQVRPDPTDAACGRCGYPSPQEARFCRRCGARRPIVDADAPEATAAPSAVVGATDRVAAFTPIAAPRTARPVAPEPTLEPPAREFGVGSLAPPDTYPTSPDAAAPWARNPIIVDPAELSPRTIRCGCGHVMSTAARYCARCGTRRRGRIWRPTVGSPGSKLSAQRTLSRLQARFLVATAAFILLLLVVTPLGTLTAAIALATVLYVAALVYRLLMFRTSLDAPQMVVISEEDARAIPDDELPVYTILVPAYREPEVIANLMASLRELDYPSDRLDIKLLLEADDPDTLAAVLAARPSANVDVLRLLPSEPRTKPKACNVGLGRARGSFVTIYDAEDRPDPLQLRRVVAAFRHLPAEVACLQAKLSYHNADQNLLTRWFTAEYALWFGQLLPGLVKLGAPVPLGGTSNHFRRELLVRLGGWDPFNVTEDADLGIRLHRLGYRTGVLDSTTMEEANSDLVNWTKQRSRWYKGYLQTWLVHMRHPHQLWKQLGTRGFIGFNLFVGGTPFLAMLNPVFWAMTALWFMVRPAFIMELFPAWLYYTSLLCLVAGNFAFLYTAVVGARVLGRPTLVFAALLSPAYWVMMSVAAIKAMVQLVAAPTFWEKTVHGLDERAIEIRGTAASTAPPEKGSRGVAA